MDCELLECCQFFDDHMKDLPKSAEFIKNRLCHGDFPSCSRYRIYKKFGRDDIPPFLYLSDAKQAQKAARCLRKRHRQESADKGDGAPDPEKGGAPNN